MAKKKQIAIDISGFPDYINKMPKWVAPERLIPTKPGWEDKETGEIYVSLSWMGGAKDPTCSRWYEVHHIDEGGNCSAGFSFPVIHANAAGMVKDDVLVGVDAISSDVFSVTAGSSDCTVKCVVLDTTNNATVTISPTEVLANQTAAIELRAVLAREEAVDGKISLVVTDSNGNEVTSDEVPLRLDSGSRLELEVNIPPITFASLAPQTWTDVVVVKTGSKPVNVRFRDSEYSDYVTFSLDPEVCPAESTTTISVTGQMIKYPLEDIQTTMTYEISEIGGNHTQHSTGHDVHISAHVSAQVTPYISDVVFDNLGSNVIKKAFVVDLKSEDATLTLVPLEPIVPGVIARINPTTAKVGQTIVDLELHVSSTLFGNYTPKYAIQVKDSHETKILGEDTLTINIPITELPDLETVSHIQVIDAVLEVQPGENTFDDAIEITTKDEDVVIDILHNTIFPDGVEVKCTHTSIPKNTVQKVGIIVINAAQLEVIDPEITFKLRLTDAKGVRTESQLISAPVASVVPE